MVRAFGVPMETSLEVGAGTLPGAIGHRVRDAEVGDARRFGARETGKGVASTDAAVGEFRLAVVQAASPGTLALTPLTPTTTTAGHGKKRRNAKPKRVDLSLQPGEDVGATRVKVDDQSSRRNKLGVCYHKPSDKWRAIVYVQKKQVNLGYFATKKESEDQVGLARSFGLPMGFSNLRALRQPKRSGFPGVNWDNHCNRWLARVYMPSTDGKKGKEIKVGYFEDEKTAAEACRSCRVQHGLPETAKPPPPLALPAPAGAIPLGLPPAGNLALALSSLPGGASTGFSVVTKGEDESVDDTGS